MELPNPRKEVMTDWMIRSIKSTPIFQDPTLSLWFNMSQFAWSNFSPILPLILSLPSWFKASHTQCFCCCGCFARSASVLCIDLRLMLASDFYLTLCDLLRHTLEACDNRRIASFFAAATGDVELCSTYASSHLNYRIARHVFRHENAWRFLIETHTSENSVKCTTIMNNFWTVFSEQNLPVNYKFPLRELQLCFDLMYLSVFLRLFPKLPTYKWVRGLIEYSSA